MFKKKKGRKCTVSRGIAEVDEAVVLPLFDELERALRSHPTGTSFDILPTADNPA